MLTRRRTYWWRRRGGGASRMNEESATDASSGAASRAPTSNPPGLRDQHYAKAVGVKNRDTDPIPPGIGTRYWCDVEPGKHVFDCLPATQIENEKVLDMRRWRRQVRRS